MHTAEILWNAARKKPKAAMPILSFPAVQKMRTTVGRLVKDSKLQAEAMRLVAEEVPSVASVSLMDLSVEAEAFGAFVRFSENEVPTIIGQLVADLESAQQLPVPTVGVGRTGVCVEAIRLAKQQITDRPVLAGVIGPYSLAGRLCDVTEIMYLCFDEPDMVHVVLEKAVEFLISYCRAFHEAGADGIVIAEPLAGLLSPDLFREFSAPYVKRIIETVQTEDFAVIYHNCGNAVPSLLDEIFAQGAAAFHFGNAVNMRDILDQAPETALCMGNIDPAGEFAGGTPESITRATRDLMEACGDSDHFVPSSGCDIPPHASWENIHAFFCALEA